LNVCEKCFVVWKCVWWKVFKLFENSSYLELSWKQTEVQQPFHGYDITRVTNAWYNDSLRSAFYQLERRLCFDLCDPQFLGTIVAVVNGQLRLRCAVMGRVSRVFFVMYDGVQCCIRVSDIEIVDLVMDYRNIELISVNT